MRLFGLGDALAVAAVELEALLEVCTGTVHAAVAGHDDALDAVIDGELSEDVFELAAHEVSEGIEVLGAVERDDYDWCRAGGGCWMVGYAQLFILEVVVGIGQGDEGRLGHGDGDGRADTGGILCSRG